MGTRVPLSVAKGLGLGLIRCHSNSSISSTTSLVKRLIEQPNSRIKPTLDAENSNLNLKSLEFSWDALLASLSSSSPQKAQLVISTFSLRI